MDTKALNDALTAGVKEALGSLQFLVISLQAEKSVLVARVAELEVRITSDGNVGPGTTQPNAPLEVKSERISTYAVEEAVKSLAGIT